MQHVDADNLMLIDLFYSTFWDQLKKGKIIQKYIHQVKIRRINLLINFRKMNLNIILEKNEKQR